MGQLLLPKGFSPGFGNPRVAPDENLVEIDWNHPLAKGLIFYSIGLRDLVSGVIAQPFTSWGSSNSAEINHGPAGFEIASNTTANGAGVVGWENCSEIQRADAQPHMTSITRLSYISGVNKVLHSAPVNRTTLTGSLYHWSLHHGGSGAGQIHFLTPADGNNNTLSATGFIEPDAPAITYAVTKGDTTSIKFYKNGVLFGTKTHSSFDDNLKIHPFSNIYLFGPNEVATKGLIARMQYHVLLARTFDAGEHQQFHNNPYALLKPRVPTLYYFPAAAGGPLNLNRLSSMHFMRHYEPISMGE